MELASQIIYVPEDPLHRILKVTRMASFSGLPMRLSSKNRLEFQEVLGECVYVQGGLGVSSPLCSSMPPMVSTSLPRS